MRVLVTRPEADAGPLVEALRARGHQALVEPLLEIEPVSSAKPDLAGVQALLFTSANGLRALAAVTAERDLPVFTVGDASAEAVRAEGFRTVTSAGGDVEDLARLVKARLDPAAGALFHGAGATLAGDLKSLLEADGFTVRRVVLYNARTVEAFSDGARQALRDGTIDAVLLFSPRTAETFAELVEKQGLTGALRDCAAACLSPAVARKVEHLPWAGVRMARQPSREALLAVLDAADRDEKRRPGSEMSEDGPAPAGKGASAQEVIAAFGGIRPMASKLGIAVSTVQGWKERGVIPAGRHTLILEAAAREGIDLDAALSPTGDRPPAGPSGASTSTAETKPETIAADSPGPAADAGRPAPETRDAGGRPPERATSVPASGAGKVRSGRSVGGALIGGLLAGAAIAGLGFLAAVLTFDLWRPLLGAPSDRAYEEMRIAIEDLSGQIAAQGRRLDTLGDELSALPAGTSGEIVGLAGGLEELTEATEDLGRRMASLETRPGLPAGLETRLAHLESRTAGEGAAADALAEAGREIRALGARLDRLEEDFAALRDRQADAGAAPGRHILVLVSVAALREAVDGGRPYRAELDRLRDATGGDAAFAESLDRLAAMADTGVATLPELRASFTAIAKDIVASGAADRYDGWIGGTMRRLFDTITIRPVGQVEGDGVGAVVARAEQRLAEGDLAAAVTELETLQDTAAGTAADWLETARARLGAQDALSAIVGLLVDRTSAADG